MLKTSPEGALLINMDQLYTIYQELFPELDEKKLSKLPGTRAILTAGYRCQELTDAYVTIKTSTRFEDGFNYAVIKVKDKFVRVEGFRDYDNGYLNVEYDKRNRAYYVVPVEVTRTEYQRVDR